MSLYAVHVKGRFYILRDIIKNEKHSTTTVEKLGTSEEIIAAHGCDDPKQWEKERALELAMKAREENDPEVRHYVHARSSFQVQNSGSLNFLKSFLNIRILNTTSYFVLSLRSITLIKTGWPLRPSCFLYIYSTRTS